MCLPTSGATYLWNKTIREAKRENDTTLADWEK